jgi:hypothetical protein
MTPNEASLLLGVSPARIEQWARMGRVRRLLLPRVGSVRVRLLVDVDAVRRVAASLLPDYRSGA